MEILELLQYPFIQRALVAGLVLAGVLSLLGVFVILRRMAFFADGIAHASLAGVAIGVVFSFNPLTTAVIATAIIAALIFLLERRFNLGSDAAIGILFTSGMALGVLLISLTPGYQPELISFLFGNILSIANKELWILIIISILVALFVFIKLKPLVLVSCDEESAYLSGVNVVWLQFFLYIITAVAIVLGIKLLGIILVSALIITPVAAAKVLARSFRSLLVYSLLLAELIMLIGLTLSIYLDWPTGPTIVLSGTVIFILVGLVKKIK